MNSSDMNENVLFRFLALAKKLGGISPHKILSIIPFLIKGILFYPFMVLERFLYKEKILNHQIPQDPIFILGYYRSGTTFLQRVLSINTDWSSITQFNTAIPECSIIASKPFLLFFQLCSKILKSKNEYHKTDWDWNLVGEEDVAFSSLASEATCYWSFMFPQKAAEYFDRFSYFEKENQQDISFWKSEYVALVRKYSYMFKGNQMLLKSPPNVAKIKELYELYPNAKFIFIYRNPYSVLKSVRRLWEINAKMNFQDNPSKEEIDQFTIKDFSLSIDRYYKYKNLVPEKNIFEIKYEDFMKDPSVVLNSLWNKFEIKNKDVLKDMLSYIGKHDGEGVTKHKFEEEDYLLTEKYLKKYLDLWGYLRPN